MMIRKSSLVLAVLLSLLVCGNAWAEDPAGAVRIGKGTSEGGSGVTAWGTDSIAIGAEFGTEKTYAWTDYSIAIGQGAVAGDIVTGASQAIAIGLQTKAEGQSSNAFGQGAQALGVYSNAIGYKSKVTAKSENSVALGYNSMVSAKNSVALGANSTVLANQENVISVGSKDAERRIVNVAAATVNTDALTFGNFNYDTNANNDKIITSMEIGDDIYYFTGGAAGNTLFATPNTGGNNSAQNQAVNDAINNEAAEREAAIKNEASERIAADKDLQDQIDKLGNNMAGDVERLDSDVKSVGAMAAAMAGLHPRFTGDGKGEFAAAIGTYDGKKATAIGAFYAPDERFMFSLGGAFAAGGKNMANLGVNIALDPKPRLRAGDSYSKAEVDAKLAEKDAQIEALMERLAALEAKK